MASVGVTANKPVVKAVALCGSLRKASFNRGLIRAAMEICKEESGIEIEYLEVEPLPMLNTDLETPDGAPLKNAIDWASRPPNVFAGKAAAIMSAGGGFGGGLAQFHLRQVGVFLDLHFVNKPEVHVHAFQPPLKFNQDGDLIHQQTYHQLKQLLLSLTNLSLRLQSNSN
ncbi:NADPH:quinone oxidoreductase-like [Cucumis melo var. makuwa]|uniref:NAD(P)H dehydrogenase (quinone) n=1 Tax=Cucumis melo var. makuwa TaxID=1194695 RepID=A0A5A7SW76_CUCMM|nr:NADPH:quinone oxidoreductase-like [Cucumis melo var. makuwa]TYK09317.1 NADPH:quinone oxidoreductase-like [Cucumis melo var. makuwa]